MIRLGFTLIILGIASIFVQDYGRRYAWLNALRPYQPFAGLAMCLLGLLLVLSYGGGYHIVKRLFSWRLPSRHRDRLHAEVEREVTQPTVASVPPTAPVKVRTYRPEPTPAPAQPAPLPAAELPLFHQGVNLAQAGQRETAYNLLKGLQTRYPADVNLLLWVAFTAPNLYEATNLIDSAHRLDPGNPTVAQAQGWLNQQMVAQP